MCGRFALYTQNGELRITFFLAEEFKVQPRYNISPGTGIMAIPGSQTRNAKQMRWGLIPSWAKDPKIGTKMINARAETIHEKPAYRTAFRKRRCIIPASGWYEWRINADGTKTPFYFSRRDRIHLAFAGIWENWTAPDGKSVDSCAIVTTAAAPRFTAIHDRMPAILSSVDAWLDGNVAVDVARRILESCDDAAVEAFPVSKLVNRAGVESADCIRPAQEA